MSQIDKKIKVNTIIQNQLPEFILSDFPNAVDFLKQYYISQEFQGGPTDLISNFNQYQKVDNLVPEVIVGVTSITSDVSSSDTTISVPSTKGFPNEYGLLKINDEIISYTGITSTSFTGCIRGFSGVTGYNVGISSSLLDVNKETLTFKDTNAAAHISGTEVKNLSVLFLQEFYKKLKRTFLPGFENIKLADELDVGNFVKFARSFYQSKGIEESITILFKVLFGVESKIIDLENNLIKPSDAEFIRREIIIADLITKTGDPSKLVGQTIFKSNDLSTNASLSEVETFQRGGKNYYKLSLFVGYSENDLIQGVFTVNANTKVLNPVAINDSVISVDSTIGFGATGTIISGDNLIDYTSKSVNQFFGCTGVTSPINTADDLRINENIFGYEDGDLSKKIELRVSGVISELTNTDNINLVNEGENIYVKNVGNKILNNNESYKEIFANVWTYNTSSRFQVEDFGSGGNITLGTNIDDSSLKVGDKFEILNQNENVLTDENGNLIEVIFDVKNVDKPKKQVITEKLDDIFDPISTKRYDIRRVIEKTNSNGVKIKEGNNKVISNVLNVYTDGDVDGYVASNSLPSYNIEINKISETTGLGQTTVEFGLEGQNATDSTKYNYIKFFNPTGQSLKFKQGDAVIYSVVKDPNSINDNAPSVAPGLIEGQVYYVDPILETDPNDDITKMALYLSRSQIGSASTIQVGVAASVKDQQIFTLQRHSNKDLSANKILRKFPLSQNLFVSTNDDPSINNNGILKNGVEINSPVSEDRIFYGPIESIELTNGGSDYDVINPPDVIVESGLGDNALIEPIISGSVKEVIVDPQDFDINSVKNISLTGGNGTGCELEAILGARFRSIPFDSRKIEFGGGIDIDDDTITFREKHNLETGQIVFYKNNGNPSVGIGSFNDLNDPEIIEGALSDGAPYFVRVINTSTIRLFNNESDAKTGNTGINTIGISTDLSASGIHEFRTESKNTILSVKVLNSGSGYQHRKLRVSPSGISTSFNTINFDNHGFKHGDIIEYSATVGLGTTQPKTIDGLSATSSYYVIKVDDNSFRLADAGIGATITNNFTRGKFVGLGSTGTGYQTFTYPEIKVNVEVVYGSTITGTFNFTPKVTGSLTGGYLYENGTDYGSKILNHVNLPDVKITSGRDASVKPIIVNGKIESVLITNQGREYSSTPDIKVISTGEGSGAILRPVIENKKLTEVIVVNTGIGYSSATTTTSVESRGKNGAFLPRIRNLTVNNVERFGSEFLNSKTDDLNYVVLSYSQKIATNFEKDSFSVTDSNEFDSVKKHSPIIGWAYDGNPIYGPFGYTDPNDSNTPAKILLSSYVKNTSNVSNRPSGFADGFFNEDYQFNNSGDLDIHNGRFCKTPEFPNGIYAYFATVKKDIDGKLDGVYPYFIGNTYRSPLIDDNLLLTQSFDFNNSSLLRNTFPYNVAEKFANNDFIFESNEIVRQSSKVESVVKGGLQDLSILNPGSGYRIGDTTIFDDEGTGGSGFSAKVSEIVGLGVSSIESTLESFESVVFTHVNQNQVKGTFLPFIEIPNLSAIQISGLSTSIQNLTDTFNVGVRTDTVGLAVSMTAIANGQKAVQDIFLNKIPNSLSVGSTIKINGEFLQVLNIFPTPRVLRVFRNAGAAHTFGSNVDILNTSFTIPVKTEKFDSKVNDIVYFSPPTSVGVGTSGGATSIRVDVGVTSSFISISNRQIYLPNHPFKTGQKVLLTVPDVSNKQLNVAYTDDPNDSDGNFAIPLSGNTQELFVIKKSDDFIGLSTVLIDNDGVVSTASTSEGLYFKSNATNAGTVGIDTYFYNLQSQFNQVTGDVDKILSTVTTNVSAANTTTHGLKNGDIVNITVIPNLAVGIGTTNPVNVEYNQQFEKLLINPISFVAADVETDRFDLENHGFRTGDKVFYEGGITGLSTGSYYVNKISDRRFSLTETFNDLSANPIKLINFNANTGGNNQKISPINPKIVVAKNSKLSFNLSNTSLTGYNFKIFYDDNLRNEFLSSGDSNIFNVQKTGVEGTVGSALTITYSNNTPNILYYAVKKGGFISTTDKDVNNYSQIVFVNSAYNGEYSISGVTSDTFNFSPKLPERLNYISDECDKLEYSTKSTNTHGGIKSFDIVSTGYNYKKLPTFKSVNSKDGINANVVPTSKTIGKIKNVRIVDIGFEYSSDKTLQPEAFISPVVDVDNLDVIESVKINSGGSGYTSPPNLLLFNPISQKIIDDSTLLAITPNQTISSVDVIAPIQGLDSVQHQIVAIDNSNGVGINSVQTSIGGIVTCFLETPFNGFPDPQPFAVGDEVYVEGIQRINEAGIGTQGGISTSTVVEGDGFNSDNYNYQFFTVDDYTPGTQAIVKFNLAGLTTNPGIAKTFQSGYASIINKNNYPDIIPIQTRGQFQLNEEIIVNGENTDLIIVEIRDDYIKLDGVTQVKTGDRIIGKTTNVSAEIVKYNDKRALFKIDYSSRQEYGWIDDIGKLNLDTQVLPDNNYYQNLSYTVRSPIVWDKFVNTVNSLVHPAGLKNFADTSIQRNIKSGINTANSNSVIVLDILNDPERVDAINNFDTVVDFDRIESKTKSLIFKNTKLTDFSICLTNRVLIHDDISDQFSSVGFSANTSIIDEITSLYQTYLIQVVDPDTFDTQLSELIVYTSENDIFLAEKTTDSAGIGLDNIDGNLRLGSFDSEKTDTGVRNLLFDPTNEFTKDHDIKILKTNYNNNILGIGTNVIGNINITGVSTDVNISATKTIVEYPKTNFNALYAKIFVQDSISKEINYNEIVLDFDGTDVTTSEIFVDKQFGLSTNNVGILTAKFENDLIKLQIQNDTSSILDINANIVGLGTTTTSTGVHRFLASGQPAGSERSGRLESGYNSGTSSPIVYSTINKFNDSTVKSVVRVSCGETSAVHQVVAIRDASDILTVQYPFVSAGSTSGIGTFGGEFNGDNIDLKFYPDSNFTSIIEVQSFNQILNTANDFDNNTPNLSYGTNNIGLVLSTFDALEGKRANKRKFALKHEGVPIYSKTFNPDGVGLEKSTGFFTIPNHFFNTNEELTYTPDSTFVGVAATPVSIGQKTLPSGLSTTILPSSVFVKAKDENQFQLFARKSDISAGTAITFTGNGSGNSHKLTMTKPLTKTIIGLDGVVQQPITFTSITHTLNMSGGIDDKKTRFVLTGISSILTTDILKLDDEFMKVEEVGFTSTSDGSGVIDDSLNISLGISIHPTVKVERGVLGIAATSHVNNTVARIHRGSFNIVDSDVHFIEPPKGNSRSRKTDTELPFVKASFSGRTFTRQDYTTNMLFDDISDNFTGIGKTYSLKVGGANTSSGIQIGNGIVFINGVFQTPFTNNNAGNNYKITADTTAGISTIEFTGITSVNGQPIVSEFDINQNQVPRGGIIVSLGSTTGLGYAPLLGAKVQPFTNSSGAITSVVGIGTSSGVSLGIQTAVYDNQSGIITVTTNKVHGFSLNRPKTVHLKDLEFSCATQHAGVTTTIFQDHERGLFLVGIVSERSFEVQAGPGTIPHIYEGGGNAFEFYEDLTFGSGYRDPVAINVEDINFLHKFVSSSSNSISVQGSGSTFTPTDAIYDSATGNLTLTIASHGLSTSNKIKIATNSLVFTCDKDNHFGNHPYPRATDPANNVFLTITAVTTDTITVNVGAGGGGGNGANITATVGAGGTLAFNIVSGGTGYINPQINIPEPTYENLKVEGISRLGIGETTETGTQLLLNVEVSAAKTSVGIGSTLFEISNFSIARGGHSFKKGDKFRPVGLVTAIGFSKPVQEFELEVLEIFNDRFSGWQFGEIDYIDSIRILQNGSRLRFPLFFNGELLSFEKDPNNTVSQKIDLDAVLLIFVNGVLQTPKQAYQFEGGSTFTFTEAPDVEDKVDIFFYKGKEGEDVDIQDVQETVKIGDSLRVFKNDSLGITTSQSSSRFVKEIVNADRVETDVYRGRGIDEKNFKPVKWTKQKTDLKLSGVSIPKTRSIIEPQIYPTAKIIGNLPITDISGTGDYDGIFVDDATSFFYEEPAKGGAGYNSFTVDEVDALITSGDVKEGATVSLSINSGSVDNIIITNEGSGYENGTVPLIITKPIGAGTTDINVGASTATATVTFTDGKLSGFNITDGGSGYNVAPSAIIELPKFETEKVTRISNVEGFVGIITGIKNVSRGGAGRALKFFYRAVLRDAEGKLTTNTGRGGTLKNDYPVLVTGTSVGSGATSVVTTNASGKVGIGTQFVDNIYIVKNVSNTGDNGEFTANIHTDSNTSISGIDTTGFYDGNNGTAIPLGTISWGRLYGDNLTRSNPLSLEVRGKTLGELSTSGLSTFPTIQRKSYDAFGHTGHRSSGSISAKLA